jgi:hypothetical protein
MNSILLIIFCVKCGYFCPPISSNENVCVQWTNPPINLLQHHIYSHTHVIDMSFLGPSKNTDQVRTPNDLIIGNNRQRTYLLHLHTHRLRVSLRIGVTIITCDSWYCSLYRTRRPRSTRIIRKRCVQLLED